tara:strand:+ start:97 stop:537 length:441 start_codon:yes stop_codon:yes gene_type:complete
MNILKLRLNEYIDKNKINLARFEYDSGLKRNILYNILSEKSKNPSIENIIKIANTLDCSIDELFGREEYFKKHVKMHRSKIKYNKDLLGSILTIINQHIIKNNIEDVSLGNVVYLIEEIYEYSTKTNNGLVDQKFTIWMLENQLEN